MENNNNLFLAIILSILILASFQYLYKPAPPEAAKHMQVQQLVSQVRADHPDLTTLDLRDRTTVIAADARVPIVTPALHGSIDLKGARFDDLALNNYRETVEPDSPPVTLLSPTGSAAPNLAYYAEFGWLADSGVDVPTDQTVWKAENKSLTPDQPLKLTWDNGHGLLFQRTISVDENYMFTVDDAVVNKGSTAATLYPFGLIMRQGNPIKSPSKVLHEGPIGVLDGTLQEHTYKELMDKGKQASDSTGGWLGITDKYWLVAMIAPNDQKMNAAFNYNAPGGTIDPSFGYFQTDYRGQPLTVAPGGDADHKVMLFAGAKAQGLLESYQDKFNIPMFDRAIDFGRFWFLTIPFLHVLGLLTDHLGSFAFAIIVFTVILKLITLPLSLKSNHSMARMRLMQPEMARIKERFPDDKNKQSQEMMELYKREGINPLAGCVPTVIQIPIFFALYKVIYIGIQMRQAPFYGWIKDLSVPDPTSIFNLFGLMPNWPATIHLNLGFTTIEGSIGAWPIIMGCTMFIQQRMSPQPPDRSQARMFMFMPILFTYILRAMPAGLVIYWSWSNLLSSLQQFYITRKDLSRGLKK